MILYCDTSALMKLFVDEQHSDRMRNTSLASTRLMVSQLTWTEMCAGMSLKQRTGQVEARLAAKALQELHAEWPRYYRLGIDEDLAATAGELALRFGLRAYDSVQLASAQRAHQQLGTAMTFCCFDKQLNHAAAALALTILE